MKKFRQKVITGCPDYISQRENYLSSKPSIFQDSSWFLSNRLHNAKCLYSKNLNGHFGCINAIEFSLDGKYLISGGDDKYVQLWNVNQAISHGPPTRMKTQHQSNVFCLAFDSINSKILSAGNDGQILVHNTKTGEILDIYLQDTALYGLSMCPNNDSVFVSAAEDGRIKVFDMKSRASDPTLVAQTYNSFHAVQFHPTMTNFIISANNTEGIIMWDLRKPKQPYQRYGGKACKEAMSVKFNHDGSQILSLIRRKSPVLFDTDTANKKCVFDGEFYYNSCTMKSCCFAGANDEFVLSGSDDFNLYMWKIPESTEAGYAFNVNRRPHMVLNGHRSIVNQVRFNRSNFLVASSGVEKVIKLWGAVPMPSGNGGLSADDIQLAGRKFFTQREYLARFGDHGRNFNNELDGTEEDLGMLAFFDALVHREISDLHSPWILSELSSESDDYATPPCEPNFFRYRSPIPQKAGATVDEVLPRLIASRRRKLKLKARLEKKFCRSAQRSTVKLSGLSTANNIRLIYDPTMPDERTDFDEYIPHLSFRRRTVAPYTVMQAENSSESSDYSSASSSTSTRSGSSSDESFQPSTSRKVTKRIRSKPKKRPCIFDSSDDDSVSPNPKKIAPASPEIGPKRHSDEISGIISSDDEQILGKDVVSAAPIPKSNAGCSSSNSCCQGTGCSSKCRRFVPICSVSEDDIDEEEESGGEKKYIGSSSAETPDSGVSLNSFAAIASSSNAPRPSTSHNLEEEESPTKIKFSITKAKNARHRCYRGQI